MTLEELLQPFHQHRLSELSSRAKKFAIGCGCREGGSLVSQDWEIVNDIFHNATDAAITNTEKIALCFAAYEQFPGYGPLTVIFRWFSEACHLPKERADFWQRLAEYLDAAPELADPVAYVLWVDLFEDPRTVEETWNSVLSHCQSEQSLNRLLAMSGPVGFELKEKLYEQLVGDRRFHHGILRSLYFSAHDVYGVIDKVKARRWLNQIHVDKNSAEYQALTAKLKE